MLKRKRPVKIRPHAKFHDYAKILNNYKLDVQEIRQRMRDQSPMEETAMATLESEICALQKEYDVVFLDLVLDLKDQVILNRSDGGYVICRRGKQFVSGQPQLFIPAHVMKKLLADNTFGLEPEELAFIQGKLSNAEFHARPKPKPGHKGFNNHKRRYRRSHTAA